MAKRRLFRSSLPSIRNESRHSGRRSEPLTHPLPGRHPARSAQVRMTRAAVHWGSGISARQRSSRQSCHRNIPIRPRRSAVDHRRNHSACRRVGPRNQSRVRLSRSRSPGRWARDVPRHRTDDSRDGRNRIAVRTAGIRVTARPVRSRLQWPRQERDRRWQ
jgi:hypothetical protein